MAKDVKKEKTTTGNNSENKQEGLISFEKSFIDTKYNQHFNMYSGDKRQTDEQISMEIIKRMVFQKTLIGYVDNTKKEIADFNPKLVPAQNVLKLRDDSDSNNPIMGIPVFTGIEQRDKFIGKPREANISENSYINWMLIEFIELLAAIKNDNSIFQSLIINCEIENSQTVIMRENGKLMFDNIISLEEHIKQVKIKSSLDNSDKSEDLKKYMILVTKQFKNIKAIKGFKFINQLIHGNGYIFEIEGEKKYEDLLEIAKICTELTPPNITCWYAFANVNDDKFDDYELLWKDNKFVFKMNENEEKKPEEKSEVKTEEKVSKTKAVKKDKEAKPKAKKEAAKKK